MDNQLTLYETRIIGSLIEKQITTPDQYPLSLNAITNACNQKTNRDPVLTLDDATVQLNIDKLAKRSLISNKSGFGSRVQKYHHRFCNSTFDQLQFSKQELAIICLLFLRGVQTPGELRTRTHRLYEFSDVLEIETHLKSLMAREDGPFIVKLPREAGKREFRYAHLFSGEIDMANLDNQSDTTSKVQEPDRVLFLEKKVEEMQLEIDMINEQLKTLL